TSFTVNSATSITATSPAGSGTVDITVTTTGGTSATGSADQFAYVAVPTVTAIAPSTGPATGGTSVTVTGTNFTGATAVKFGATAATSFTVNSATSITATSPAGSGTVDITVTTTGGTSATGSADQFAYVAVPTVTAITPSTGPATGGTSVTVTGTNFTGATAVKFGATAAASFTVNSATSITATSPAGSGTVDITVTTTGGTSATGSADKFSYVSAPTVTSISPSSGALSGGTSVTITGTNFTGATAVLFGTTAAPSFTVNSATSITATSPAGSGAINVKVVTPGGTSATSAAAKFTYASVPTIASVGPGEGPATGGTRVSIRGTNLAGATAVKFGATAATSFTVNSATSITATAPAGTGTVNIRVTTAGGTSAVSGSDKFSYVAAPAVTAINPSRGPAVGGTSVTISGTNLAGATAVKFGSINARSFTVANGKRITAIAPAGTGTVDITVTTIGGTSATTSDDKFSYVSVPVITALTPNEGPTFGGTRVTIAGTDLSGATAVKFGSLDAAAFTVNNSSRITAISPAGSGTVNVFVVTPGGTSRANAASHFSYTRTTPTIGLTSSPNPSELHQKVTFTAMVSGRGGTPSGTVIFKDGSVVLGKALLVRGRASFAVASLSLGMHSITATYTGDGNFIRVASTALSQSVDVPKDSQHLRAMQIQATPVAAQVTGQVLDSVISNAVDTALSGNPQPFVLNGSGFTANLFADPPATETAETRRPNWLADPGRPAGNRFDNAFGAFAYKPQATVPKARPPAFVEPRQWFSWVDVRAVETLRNSASDDFHGYQINAIAGLTRKLTPDLVIGALGGYENFSYSSDTLNGRLNGEGWTLGAYLGWNISKELRLDLGVARSQVDFNASSGMANASFPGNRWLVTGGLTGSLHWQGFDIQPSTRIYALWEHEGGYIDSLGIAQPERNFSGGRASAGTKVGRTYKWDNIGVFSPYVGLYGDYYFSEDDVAALPAGTEPLLQGWSARATGGVSLTLKQGPSLNLGVDLGGIASTTYIWSYRGQLRVPF
ncbi:MAG TPA: IPT/TIG domain-containing protein, partial [Pseudolabrys sp.]|nr:IPT/TIG domain-containing protein [Pseudolabrys sp.]